MEQLNHWYQLSIPALGLAVSIVNNTINGQCLSPNGQCLSPKYWIHEVLTTNKMYSSMTIDHQRK